MKKSYSFVAGGIFLLSLMVACRTANTNDEKNLTESFKMADKKGNYWLVTVSVVDDKAVYRKKLIEPAENEETFGGLKLIVSDEVESEAGKIKYLANKKYWFIPIDRDTIYSLETGGGSTRGPDPTGEYYCECEEAEEVTGLKNCRMVTDPFRTCNFWWLNECKRCDLRWCPSSRGSGPSMPYGTLIEASEITIGNEASSELRSSPSSFIGGNVEIQVIQNDNSVTIQRQNMGNVSYPRNIYNLTGRGVLNGQLNLLPNKSYWFVPFDMNEPAFRFSGGGTTVSPTCHSNIEKPCKGDCSLEPLEKDNRCLECKCSEEGECDMHAASYSFSSTGGLIIQAETLIVQ